MLVKENNTEARNWLAVEQVNIVYVYVLYKQFVCNGRVTVAYKVALLM